MNITFIYTLAGYVPKEESYHLALYCDMLGRISQGVARSTFDLELERWAWDDAARPPLCIFKIDGEGAALHAALVTCGKPIVASMDGVILDTSAGP